MLLKIEKICFVAACSQKWVFIFLDTNSDTKSKQTAREILQDILAVRAHIKELKEKEMRIMAMATVNLKRLDVLKKTT